MEYVHGGDIYTHKGMTDGLNLLAKTGAWGIEQVRKNSSGYVLTPHMKEMSRLTGYSVQELKNNRRELLRNYTEKVHAVCVLKDSRTLTAAPTTRSASTG